MSPDTPDELEKLLDEVRRTIHENRKFLSSLADDAHDDGQVDGNLSDTSAMEELQDDGFEEL